MAEQTAGDFLRQIAEGVESDLVESDARSLAREVGRALEFSPNDSTLAKNLMTGSGRNSICWQLRSAEFIYANSTRG